MMRLLMITLAMLSIPLAARAQPFGFSMGDVLEEGQIVKKLNDFKFIAKPVKTHPEFDEVVVVTAPHTGICLVRGVGKSHSNDDYGIEIRKAFAEIREQVDKNYGDSKLFDKLLSDSIWIEPKYWAMGIKTNQRYYQAVWEATGIPFAHGVSEILLTTEALGSDTTYITLQFRFSNYTQCDAAIKDAGSKAF